jgi:hypothetical protein
MKPEYFERLPTATRELVQRFEYFASTQIDVRVDTRPVSPTSPNPDRLACMVTEREAIIWLREADVFPPDAVTHELLHVERQWNEGVPQIVPLSDPTGAKVAVTSAIENALEHLIIVPREEAYGYDPYPYWAQTTRRNWGKYPWLNITKPEARRRSCLLGWLTAERLVKDAAVREHVRSCLQKEKLVDEAMRFSETIGRTLSSKLLALATTVRFLKIPPEDFTGVVADVRNRRRIEVAIPRH